MIITPHTRFAARYFASLWNVVPTIWPVINGVKEEALMFGRSGEVGFAEKRFCDGKSGRQITSAQLGLLLTLQIISESNVPLGCNRGGGAVNRFVIVEWFGGPVEVVTHLRESRGARVPIRNSV